ncbi:hypothetical protein HELRODRAFT_160889 [Helobdella robusta]|uniref:Uncharacterized protein n=1 Tax=Helobdella robusta TaxID=6412 RepID=T1EQU4_HELRO|nr:hypothetical protein HELRODRAFT_160889 [Helobdella robusta]ESO06694.1 hypothetical protein HELRODRAFT_160889 [Helobdella robusta]
MKFSNCLLSAIVGVIVVASCGQCSVLPFKKNLIARHFFNLFNDDSSSSAAEPTTVGLPAVSFSPSSPSAAEATSLSFDDMNDVMQTAVDVSKMNEQISMFGKHERNKRADSDFSGHSQDNDDVTSNDNTNHVIASNINSKALSSSPLNPSPSGQTRRQKRLDNTLNKRSLCPWTIIQDFQANRNPQTIYKAQCDISVKGAYSCEHVYMKVLTMVYTNGGWVSNMVDVPVGCITAVPVTASASYVSGTLS